MKAVLSSAWVPTGSLIVLQGLAALVLLLGAPVGGNSLSSFPLDDSWIHLVYARSFAERFALEYNQGTLEAGMTSPLWVIMLGAVLRVVGTGAPVAAAKGLSLLFGIVGLAGTVRLGDRLAGPTAGLVSGLALLAIPEWTFAGLSGMEVTATAAILVWIAVAYLEDRRRLGILLLALAPLIRPETLPVVAVFAVAFSRPDGRDLIGSLRRLAVVSFPAGLAILGWVGYHLVAVGRPLPNTFYVKAGRVDLFPIESLQSLPTLWIFPMAEGTILGALFVSLAVLGGLVCATRRRGALLLWGATVLLLLAVISVAPIPVSGSSFYFRRYYDPALPLLAGLLALVVVDSVPALRGRFRSSALRFAALAGAFLLSGSLVHSWRLTQLAYAVDTNAIHQIDVGAARWIAEHVPAGQRIAVYDSGAIKWYLPDHQIIDVTGLNTSGAGRLPLYTVIERFQPDYLVFWRLPEVDAMLADETVVARIRIERENKGPLVTDEMSIWKLRVRPSGSTFQTRDARGASPS